MQRGVLTLTKDELTQLLTILDINIFSPSQLFEKLNSASQSTEENIQIFLSEDEIEKILDQIGVPYSDNNILNSALSKISSLMESFR